MNINENKKEYKYRTIIEKNVKVDWDPDDENRIIEERVIETDF